MSAQPVIAASDEPLKLEKWRTITPCIGSCIRFRWPAAWLLMRECLVLHCAGGFGCVYTSSDDTGKKYALKKVRIHDKESLDSTSREVEVLVSGLLCGRWSFCQQLAHMFSADSAVLESRPTDSPDPSFPLTTLLSPRTLCLFDPAAESSWRSCKRCSII